jgi:hypothetical protein
MKWVLWVALVATLLVALLLGAFLAWAVTEGIPPGTAIVIDGERFEIGRIGALLAERWGLTALAVLFVAAVLVVVVPLVVLLAVGLPLAGGALGLALVLAPVGLLVWWLWRLSEPAGETTIRT